MVGSSVMRKGPLSQVLAVLASLALAGSVAVAQEETPSAECAAPRFSPQLMTPLVGTIPRDGSFVVGLVPGGTVRELPPMILRRGRRGEIAVRRDEIAPGLFRVTPDARRIYGRHTLEGVAGNPQIQFGRPGLPAPPARPAVERVERYRVASGSGSHEEVRAHFGFPIPAGVVAVVSYWGDDPTPDLWTRGVPTRDETVLWTSTGRCSELPGGATEPPREGNARIAFVDQYGQLSQPSEPRPLVR